ncbi:hypothetical protein FIU93_23035 [Labrenzia sp. THAF35]|uniref:hypothetical protein n=1 Tax=Labrenzia sp. THAF35 TaxID=2587854 RepID=UPI001268EA0A|nr:hypothetical protein [Labrenzia sp. THAF35]QFT69678.1 hypothetical protein FIU93_23035 [Labrenzia sp. THAF35]
MCTEQLPDECRDEVLEIFFGCQRLSIKEAFDQFIIDMKKLGMETFVAFQADIELEVESFEELQQTLSDAQKSRLMEECNRYMYWKAIGGDDARSSIC